MDPVSRLAFYALRERFDEQWLAEQARVRGTFLVARDVEQGQVVGFALAEKVSCDAHLLALAVRDQRRGEGIGRALVGEVRQQMACSGAMRLHLEVRADDEGTQAFYRQLGFHPTGLESQVYSDGGDALVMARPL
ncbi:MAG: GNAT family N-acetyltransferase [Thermoplasmatota archaeon]